MDASQDDFARAYEQYNAQLYKSSATAFGRFWQEHPDHPRAPDALFYQANSLLALDRTSQAVERYQLLLKKFPAHPLALEGQFALGQYYYNEEQYSRAQEFFEEVLTAEPPRELLTQTFYWMGQTLLNRDQPQEAREYFTRIEEDFAKSEFAPQALYAIGYSHAGEENYNAAADVFESLSARYPRSPYARNTRLALAEAYYELGNYERAITELKQAMSGLDEQARERATFLLAEAHNQLEQHEDAIVYYRRFTEANENSPYYRRALYGLAWNYHNEGVYEWAAENFQNVRANTNDSLAHRAMYYEAVNLKLAGQPSTAISRFEGVTTLWPDGPLSSYAQFEKGMTHYELREWSEAVTAFRQLVEQYPNAAKAGEGLRMLAEAHVALGEFTQALEAYNAAIELEAASPALKREVQFQKAWLLYRGNRYQDAAPAFLSLYEENPSGKLAGDALFWAAESNYQAENYQRANELYGQFLENFSSNNKIDAAHYALGWVHFKTQSYEPAARHFRQFLDNYTGDNQIVPYQSDARLRLADSYFALRQYDRAIELYRQVQGDGLDYAIFQIGKAYYNSDNHYEAINTFQRLLESFPYSRWREEAQYLIGYIYFQNEDYEQAIEEYRSLIQRYPEHELAARAQYGIGDALYNTGDHRESIDAYKALLNQYPDSPYVVEAITGTQYSMMALDMEDSLTAVVDSFAARNPDSERLDEVRFRLAEVKFQSGQLKEAITSFQRFVRTANSDDLLPEAYLYIGRAYADEEEYSEAIGYLEQIINRYPDSPLSVEAAQRLGTLYEQEEQYSDALEIYRQLEQMQPDDPKQQSRAKYGQGTALLRMNRADDAEALFREAVETAPDTSTALPARLGLARVYEEQGRTDEAIGEYRTVAERADGEVGAEAHCRLGELQLKQGEPKQALDTLSRIPVLFPAYRNWIARSYLIQARAHRSLGSTGQANQMYQRVIDNFEDTEYAEPAAREQNRLSASQ
jgi:TolA-binding protein